MIRERFLTFHMHPAINTHTHTQARSQINYPMAILPCTRMRYTLCARISLTSSLSCSRVQNVEGVCTFYTCTPLDRPASVFFDQEYNTLRSSGAKTSLLDLVMGQRNWFEVFVESRRVRVEGTRGGGKSPAHGRKARGRGNSPPPRHFSRCGVLFYVVPRYYFR